MKKAELIKKLLILAETLKTDINDRLAETYWMIFKNYPDDALNQAINYAMKTCIFFPKPVELIELIEGSPSDKSLAAWNLTLKAIRSIGGHNVPPQFEDNRIMAVIADMGDWEEFCRIDNAKDLYLKEKSFREKYQHYLKQSAPATAIDISSNQLRIGVYDEPVYKQAT